jgi:hypothetical protein
MKCKWNLILVCLLGALLLPAAAQAQFTYTTLNGQVTVTGYSGTVPDSLVIPDTINGLPVVAIGDDAFSMFIPSPLHFLTIGKNVASIGQYAFDQSELTSLTIPNSVTSIGAHAFEGCHGLTSLTIGNGVTSISNDVFYNCFSLTNVTIPNSITSIGEGAFYKCAFTSVTIPSSVTFIDDFAFSDCLGLKAAYFQGNVPTLGGTNVFARYTGDATNITIYYQVGAAGWRSGLFDGYLPVPYSIIINGGFDDTGDFGGWTIAGTGSAQVTGPNVYSGPYAAVFNETAATLVNGRIIFGTTNLLSQTLPTQPGASYVLSFAVNGIAGGYCYVSWNGAPVVPSQFNPGWTMFHYVVKATSANTVLQFYIPDVYNEAQTIAIDSVSVVPPPQIAAQRISGGQVQLSAFTGVGANYALDRASSLTPPINWVQQSTASSDSLGNVTFTTTPSSSANNFWRFRSLP